jgi:AcrR family transcriptional regulator
MNQVSSSPRPLPVTARGQRTRERILRAAEEVFGDRGFERASVAEIAGRAGVALGTFYIYFPDKKSAFVELVDELGSRLRRDLGEATRDIKGRLAAEREGLRAFFAFVRAHRKLYRIVPQAEFVDEPTFRRYYDRLASRYAAGLRKAMSEGEVREGDPEVLAYAMMGMADFLGMRWVLWAGDEEEDLDHIVEEASRLFRTGLEPGAAPAPAAPGLPPAQAPRTQTPAKKGKKVP